MSGGDGPFRGGFRFYSVGRDAAQRFRIRPPWKARAAAGPVERALVGALTFLLALPVAVLLLALGLVLLAVFLGCAAVFVAFAIAAWIVRRIVGGGGAPRPRRDERPADDGRENVRVLPRQDPDA